LRGSMTRRPNLTQATCFFAFTHLARVGSGIAGGRKAKNGQ
jgi:hypothetical protein